MPDLAIFVGAMMGKNIVPELPEPCRGDLRGFSKICKMICLKLHKIVNTALNRVEVRDLGLKLWENDATPLISIFIPVLDKKYINKIKKVQKYA